MKCVVCHSPEIEKKAVNESFWMENDVVLIPVEIPVCTNCGERYYDRRTMRWLEEIEDRLRDRTLTLNTVGKVLELNLMSLNPVKE